MSSDDAGEDELLGADLGDQVVPHLLADGKYFVVALAESSDGLGPFCLGHAQPSIINDRRRG